MIDNFRVLDLFSGAGGFSYGIDKNSHFKTLLALDFNENALKHLNTICLKLKLLSVI